MRQVASKPASMIAMGTRVPVPPSMTSPSIPTPFSGGVRRRGGTGGGNRGSWDGSCGQSDGAGLVTSRGAGGVGEAERRGVDGGGSGVGAGRGSVSGGGTAGGGMGDGNADGGGDADTPLA